MRQRSFDSTHLIGFVWIAGVVLLELLVVVVSWCIQGGFFCVKLLRQSSCNRVKSPNRYNSFGVCGLRCLNVIVVVLFRSFENFC